MKKIDLTDIEVFTSIDKGQKVIINAKNDLATAIYNNERGLPYRALAYKLYNATDEVELNENETKLLLEFTEKVCTVSMYESIENILQ